MSSHAINGLPISKGSMTNEMQQFVVDMYRTLSVEYHHSYFQADKIPLALKAIGIENPNEATVQRSNQTETVDLKEFIKIVGDHLDTAGWCAAEMNEAFAIFDKDGHGKLIAFKITSILLCASLTRRVVS